MQPNLELSQLTKSFPGVLALDQVSFSVRPGRVHALCGENGAGKSTLLKILSGVYRPDSGTMSLGDERLEFVSPHDAIQRGVSVIYQELNLVPEMTVAENIFLGHLPATSGFVSKSELNDRAESLLAEVGLEVSPARRLGTLSLAQRQMVEIAKALSRDARILAFDEPTSSLTAREVERLFHIIRGLAERGKVVFYVSHRMDEIFQLCDSATVLRDGRHVETFEELSGTDSDTLINRMVGRSLEATFGYRTRALDKPRLTVGGLVASGLNEPLSLEVRGGEIVGIFGLIGAGRTELLKAIYGESAKRTGEVKVDDRSVAPSPAKSIRSGLMLCPEDRKGEGIIAIRSVLDNINISSRRTYSRHFGWIDERKELENAKRQVQRLSIRTPSVHQQIGLLSGGNQQKTILGRWLSEDVKVLMLDEPTRGVDVGAKREIYEILFELAAAGIAILFVSSELPEVLGMADRILVMREGKIVAELDKSEANEAIVLRHALPTAESPAA